jgi:hypothetical protein
MESEDEGAKQMWVWKDRGRQKNEGKATSVG